MVIFDNPGESNTDETIDIAVSKAIELRSSIVIASSSGKTAVKLLAHCRNIGFEGKLVAVSEAYGMYGAGKNDMPEETRKELESSGVRVVTCAHSLSSGERCLTKKYGGTYPMEISADTLRMFGQGVKVCVEISLMAADNGAIDGGIPTVCVAGTAGGCDTACVVTPSYTSSFLDTRVNEILCKPGLYKE